MKRYRLKKDLPTFTVGDIFILTDEGSLYKDTGKPIPMCVYTKYTLDKFPNILPDWFEEIPEKPKTVWDLKEGDACWLVWHNDNYHFARGQSFDKVAQVSRETGNCYLTMEDAMADIARHKAKQILLQDTKGFKPNINNPHESKYYVYYELGHNMLGYSYSSYWLRSEIYFATEEDVKASVAAHEKEWKTYLGVEE